MGQDPCRAGGLRLRDNIIKDTSLLWRLIGVSGLYTRARIIYIRVCVCYGRAYGCFVIVNKCAYIITTLERFADFIVKFRIVETFRLRNAAAVGRENKGQNHE